MPQLLLLTGIGNLLAHAKRRQRAQLDTQLKTILLMCDARVTAHVCRLRLRSRRRRVLAAAKDAPTHHTRLARLTNARNIGSDKWRTFECPAADLSVTDGVDVNAFDVQTRARS